jgi:hypothetical protein
MPSRQHQRLTIRSIMVVALFCMGIPAIARPLDDAQASNPSTTKEQDTDVVFDETDPCTSEVVHVVGKMSSSTIQRPNFFRSRFHEFGKGTGVSTSDRYQYQQTQETEIKTTAKTFEDEFEMRKHIIRLDSTLPAPDGDDFFLYELVKTVVKDGKPTVSVEKSKTDCK